MVLTRQLLSLGFSTATGGSHSAGSRAADVTIVEQAALFDYVAHRSDGRRFIYLHSDRKDHAPEGGIALRKPLLPSRVAAALRDLFASPYMDPSASSFSAMSVDRLDVPAPAVAQTQVVFSTVSSSPHPRSASPVSPFSPNPPPAPIPLYHSPLPFSGIQPRVLIVDDASLNRKIIARYLAKKVSV